MISFTIVWEGFRIQCKSNEFIKREEPNLYRYATNSMFKDKNKNQESLIMLMEKEENCVWAAKSH